MRKSSIHDASQHEVCIYIAQKTTAPPSNNPHLLMAPYYGPDEDPATIFLERSFLAGDFVSGVGYGEVYCDCRGSCP